MRTLLFFKTMLVSKNFLDKGRGEYHDIPSKVLSLTGPNIFEVEPFSVSLLSGSEKFLLLRGVFQDFLWKKFLSHGAEKYRSGTFLFFRKLGYR